MGILCRLAIFVVRRYEFTAALNDLCLDYYQMLFCLVTAQITDM